jgi:hypothetical protein
MNHREGGRKAAPHLRAADCVAVEERLLGGTPADAAALLAAADDPAAAHLVSCEACAALAADLAVIGELPAVRAPQAVVDAALRAARAELRAIRLAARRRGRRLAVRVALAALVCLPISAAWAALLWRIGASWIAPLLPQPFAVALGAGFSLSFLTALSALAFTLTLLAGSATRPAEQMHAFVEV